MQQFLTDVHSCGEKMEEDRMKKRLWLIAVLLVLLCLNACGKSALESAEPNPGQESAEPVSVRESRDSSEQASLPSESHDAVPSSSEAPSDTPNANPVEVPGSLGMFFDGKTFRTENPSLTRGEWVKMLSDSFGLEGTAPEGSSFTDIPADHPLFVYAQACLAWGVLSPGTLSPNDGATLAFAVDTGVAAMGEKLTAYEGSREEKALRFAIQEKIVPEDADGSAVIRQAEAEWILSALTHRFLHSETEPFCRIELQDQVRDYRDDDGFILNTDETYLYCGNQVLETGRVYVLPGNDEHPEGLAIKITSITKNNDGSVLVSWEKPEYYEVFSEAEVLNRVVPRIEDMELAEGVSLVEYIPGSYDRAQGETNDFIKTDKTYSDYVEYPTWVFEVELSKGDVKPKISVEYDDVKGSLDLSGLVSLVPGKEDAKAICDEAVKAYNRDEISIEEMASRIEEAQKGKHEAMPAPQKYKSDSGCKGKIKVTLSEMYFDYYAYIETGFLGLFPELDNFTCTLNKKINVDIDFQGYFSEEIKLFSINLTGTHLARVELDVYLVFEANGDLELKYAVSKCSRIDYDKGNWRKAAEKDANGRLNLALSTSAEVKPCVKLVLDAFGLYEKDLLDVGFSIKAEFKGEIGIEQEAQWYETPKGRQCDVTTVLNSSVKLTAPIIELYVNLNVLGIKVNTSLDLVSRDDAFVITALENKTVLAQTSYLVSDEVLSKSPSETRTVYVEGLKGKRSGAPIRDDSILFYDYYDYDGDGEKELLLVRSASEGTQITLVLWDGDQYQMTLDTDESLLNAYGPGFPVVSLYDIQGDKAVLRSEAILPHRSVDTFVRYETESGVKLAAASLKERSGVAEKYWFSLFLLEFKPDESVRSHILFSHSWEYGNDFFISELSGKNPEKIYGKWGQYLISGLHWLLGQNRSFKELCWDFAASIWGLINQPGILLSPYSHDDLFQVEGIDLRFAPDEKEGDPTAADSSESGGPAESSSPAEESGEAERIPNHLAKLKVGDIIEFGRYDQDGVSGEEPIEWIVLEKREDKLLVISRYCFETSVYSASGENWKNSQARSWLNGSFLDSSFSQEERDLILKTKNYDGEWNPTTDSIFLLSADEVELYMTPAMVSTSATPNAVNHGAYVVNGEVFWWLRSKGEGGERYQAHTRTGGMIDFEGEDAGETGALRPVMCLSTYDVKSEQAENGLHTKMSRETREAYLSYLEELREAYISYYKKFYGSDNWEVDLKWHMDHLYVSFFDITGDGEVELLLNCMTFTFPAHYLVILTYQDHHLQCIEDVNNPIDGTYQLWGYSSVGIMGGGESAHVITAAVFGSQGSLYWIHRGHHGALLSMDTTSERFTLYELCYLGGTALEQREVVTLFTRDGEFEFYGERKEAAGFEEAKKTINDYLLSADTFIMDDYSGFSPWIYLPFWEESYLSMSYQEAIEFLKATE